MTPPIALRRPIRVAALTGDRSDGSSRFRLRQLMPLLARSGVEVTDLASGPGRFPPPAGAARIAWLLAALRDRAAAVRDSRRFDLTIIQRELIATLPSFESWTKRPRVVDVDDAIWLHRSGLAARQLAAIADHVVCGNDYIATFFAGRGADVSILPTLVDCDRFTPRPRSDDTRLIGWSGSSSGYQFLLPIMPALRALLARHPTWKLRVVADRPPDSIDLPASQFEFCRWSETAEARLIQGMDIGIMPIDDSEWSRGKCSYKMLLYMACGLPVVVSDYGMNSAVLAMGTAGYGVRTAAQWIEALADLMENGDRRIVMGAEGRRVVMEHFNLAIGVDHWRSLVERLVA